MTQLDTKALYFALNEAEYRASVIASRGDGDLLMYAMARSRQDSEDVMHASSSAEHAVLFVSWEVGRSLRAMHECRFQLPEGVCTALHAEADTAVGYYLGARDAALVDYGCRHQLDQAHYNLCDIVRRMSEYRQA
jgi:hypothetical protein